MKQLLLSIAITSIGFASQAGTINVDSAQYYFKLGKEAFEGRRYSVAWQQYEKASGFDNRNMEIYTGIVDVCTKMNRMGPAIKALEQMNKLQPDNLAITKQLTDAYFAYGQCDKVMEYALKLQKANPDAQGVSYMLGKCSYTQQNYGKGIEYLKKAVKEDPSNSEAYYMIGRMMLNMANYAGAVPYYEKSLQLDNSKPIRTYEFAMLLATAEQFNKSIAYFEKALDQGYPANDEFYKNMAYTYADAKQADKGIDMLKKILDHRPQDIALLDGIADACYHAGHYQEAITYWDRIFDYDAKNARALYRIGLAYLKTGNEKDGKVFCDKAIAMDPSLEVLRHKQMLQ